MRRMKPVALLLALLVLAAQLPLPAAAESNEMIIYRFLRQELELNEAAACGVLANIECESNFNPHAMGDSGTSYGICQWHNGRWSSLKSYRPNDWDTLTGQLEYLRYELIHSKQAVWRYITSVSNDVVGAYQAGHYWCYHFEIPRNYPSVSVKRGNLAKNSYWPKYTGKAVVEGEVPSIVGASAPETLTEGHSGELYGEIYSDTPLDSVTATLLDEQQREVLAPATLNPAATSFSLHTLGRHVGFQQLQPGQYTLQITAANLSGTQSWSQPLTVLPGSHSTPTEQALTRLMKQAVPEICTARGQNRVAVEVLKTARKILQ